MTTTGTQTNESKFREIRIRREMKNKIFKVDGPKCVWCGCETLLNTTGENSNFATLEHVIPLCVGGTDDFENLTISCLRCNTERFHPPEILLLDNILNKLENPKRLEKLFWC